MPLLSILLESLSVITLMNVKNDVLTNHIEVKNVMSYS